MASPFPISRRSPRHLPPRHRLAAVALTAATPCWAQTPPASDSQLPTVVVTGRAAPSVGVSGWGDVPLSRTPLQARVFDAEQLKDRGVQRLSDLAASDAAVSDAYNTEGYWDYLTVRGFVLDNRFNFRRDGLPISAETSIPLENKSRIEILKGTSGMQAGTSAPGGLVNYEVKRPLDGALRSAAIDWRQRGSVTASLDVSQRFGAADAFGLRVNAAAAHLDPLVRSAQGDRRVLALAGDWRLSRDTLIEVEVETSHRSQPSVPGFSLLGNTVPAPVDPRINLNNQPWSQPVVFDGDTASLRWQQRLAADWRLTTHLATQRLRTDDRIAFPFGCTDPNPPPDGTYYADRYCPDGTFDLYDFRSDNERRRTDALDVSLQGRVATGAIGHALTVGVLSSRVKNRFQRQAFNYAGAGNVDGTAITPAAPDLTDENTNRDERSTELYLRDALTLTDQLTAWVGLRHTRLHRESVRTDGSRATAYDQGFTTPFIAASYAIGPEQMVYASWGRGVESDVTPNRTRYGLRAGTALPALKSRQIEVGIKASSSLHEWGVALFDIERPLFTDIGSCDADGTCTRQVGRHPAPPRAGGQQRVAAGRLDTAWQRPVAARPPPEQPDPGPERSSAHQRAGPHPQAASSLRGAELVAAHQRPVDPGRPAVRERTHGTARQQPAHPRIRPRRPGRALGHPGRGRAAHLAGRRGQRIRQAGLARIALPVQPRLPLPPGAPHIEDLRPGRALSPAPNADILCDHSSIAQSVERRTVNP